MRNKCPTVHPPAGGQQEQKISEYMLRFEPVPESTMPIPADTKKGSELLCVV